MWLPAPTALAKAWQCASAPANPPRLPPLPIGGLVTKKLMERDGAEFCCATKNQEAKKKGIVNAATKDGILAICFSGRERQCDRSRPCVTCKWAGISTVCARGQSRVRWRILAVFKGAGFLILDSLFPLADCARSFHRARRVPRGRKIRTLHRCG